MPTPSPDGTVVLAGSAGSITDTAGNVWTITTGGQVAINGTTDTTTSSVVELAYVSGVVWQENASGLWFGKASPSASWTPTLGTSVNPLQNPNDPFAFNFAPEFGVVATTTTGSGDPFSSAFSSAFGNGSASVGDPFSSAFSSAFGAGAAATGSLAASQQSQTILAAGTHYSGTSITGSLHASQAIQGIASAGVLPTHASAYIYQASQQGVAAAFTPFAAVGGALVQIQGQEGFSGAAIASTTFHVGYLTATQDIQRITNAAVVNSGPTIQPTAIVGSQSDMLNRLTAVLPVGWFPDVSPVRDGLLTGIAQIWSSLWEILEYIAQQKRISTATDINLDIISSDFLGTGLPRKTGETDTSYRARILGSIFQRMGTRSAVSAALTNLTGSAPKIFEPTNAGDTGGWGSSGSALNTGLGYGVAGGYGSYLLPFQAFVQTTLPPSSTTSASGVQGYGIAGAAAVAYQNVVGGYGSGSIEYISDTVDLITSSDEEVYDAINTVKPVATTIWVSTSNTSSQGNTTTNPPLLDSTFILDVSRLG